MRTTGRGRRHCDVNSLDHGRLAAPGHCQPERIRIVNACKRPSVLPGHGRMRLEERSRTVNGCMRQSLLLDHGCFAVPGFCQPCSRHNQDMDARVHEREGTPMCGKLVASETKRDRQRMQTAGSLAGSWAILCARPLSALQPVRSG